MRDLGGRFTQKSRCWSAFRNVFLVQNIPKILKNFRLRRALTPWGARDFSSPVLNREKLVIKVLNRGKLVDKRTQARYGFLNRMD